MIGSVIDLATTVIDRVIPDKAKATEAKVKLLEMQTKGELDLLLAQTEVNKLEAQSKHLFVAGWRPFLGWIGGSALAWMYILAPLIEWVAMINGVTTPLPKVEATPLVSVVLGLAGLRTFDKVKHVSGGH